MPKLYEADSIIIKQGDEGNFMCVLVDGQAQVLFNDQVVATLKYNTAFGEAALKHKVQRNATIKAVTECKVLILHKQDYDLILSDFDKLRKRQDLDFLINLPYLSKWDNLQKHYFNEVIDRKLISHKELVYKQGDISYTFNLIRSGYVKLITNLNLQTVSRVPTGPYKWMVTITNRLIR